MRKVEKDGKDFKILTTNIMSKEELLKQFEDIVKARQIAEKSIENLNKQIEGYEKAIKSYQEQIKELDELKSLLSKHIDKRQADEVIHRVHISPKNT